MACPAATSLVRTSAATYCGAGAVSHATRAIRPRRANPTATTRRCQLMNCEIFEIPRMDITMGTAERRSPLLHNTQAADVEELPLEDLSPPDGAGAAFGLALAAGSGLRESVA